MFHDCSQKNYLNISLSKTFLNEKLQVKLAGKHLLNRRMSLYDGRINNIYFWQNEDVSDGSPVPERSWTLAPLPP